MTTLPTITFDEALEQRVEPQQFVTRELDAERIVAAWRTHETLREMRKATPTLRTLTVIDVIYDIVRALRNKHRSE